MSSNSKKLGIFVCTRDSVEGLSRLIESIFCLCYNKHNIELWIGYDEDDRKTKDFLESIKQTESINVYENATKSEQCEYCNEYFLNRHKDIIDPMVKSSDADYMWVLNDDNEILTKHFDKHIEDNIEEYLSDKSDRIFYGMVDIVFEKNGILTRTLPSHEYNLLALGTDYSCYPLLTKESVEAIGFLLPTEFPDNGADIVLGQGFGLSGYRRKFNIPITVKDLVQGFGENRRVNPEHYFPRNPDGSIEYTIKDFKEKLSDDNKKCRHSPKGSNLGSSLMNTPINIAEKLNSRLADYTQETSKPKALQLSVTYFCNSCNTYYSELFFMHNMITTCTRCKKTSWIDASENFLRSLEALKTRVGNIGRHYIVNLPEQEERDEVHRRSK